MGKPDGSIPPPSSSIPPSGCPRPGRPPQGPGEASGPARPGSPQGKGCLCLKVTTRARCPGWACCLPLLGRGGGDGGPPQISEVTGVRLTSLLPTPRNGPLREQPASGGGGQLLSLLGGGGPSQLLSLFRGGGEEETQWLPSASIPPQHAVGPVSPRHPRRDLRRERRGRARGGDEGSPAPAGKPPSAAPLPSSSPKGREQGERRGGPPDRGRGSPHPSPRGTLGLVFPPLHCIPGSRREGRGGTGRRVWAGEPGVGGGGPRRIGAAVMERRGG